MGTRGKGKMRKPREEDKLHLGESIESLNGAGS